MTGYAFCADGGFIWATGTHWVIDGGFTGMVFWGSEQRGDPHETRPTEPAANRPAADPT
jgi:hypothetical protein